jgi:uncharacterized protein with HEPN domain
MTKDQRLYCRDILERIRRIEVVAAEGEAIFRESFMHQDTLIRSFEVVGEVVKRLDPVLTAHYPDIDWSAYAGFRDVLIHQYDKVILDIVWRSSQRDIAPLKAAIEAILASLSDSELSDEPE